MKAVHRYHCFDEVSSCSWSRSTGVEGETIIYIENISSLVVVWTTYRGSNHSSDFRSLSYFVGQVPSVV